MESTHYKGRHNQRAHITKAGTKSTQFKGRHKQELNYTQNLQTLMRGMQKVRQI
jgi:hypothetical protein